MKSASPREGDEVSVLKRKLRGVGEESVNGTSQAEAQQAALQATADVAALGRLVNGLQQKASAEAPAAARGAARPEMPAAVYCGPPPRASPRPRGSPSASPRLLPRQLSA